MSHIMFEKKKRNTNFRFIIVNRIFWMWKITKWFHLNLFCKIKIQLWVQLVLSSINELFFHTQHFTCFFSSSIFCLFVYLFSVTNLDNESRYTHCVQCQCTLAPSNRTSIFPILFCIKFGSHLQEMNPKKERVWLRLLKKQREKKKSESENWFPSLLWDRSNSLS